ncbi:MAG: peptidyl-prolyl cis-trans isomerase [Myxococcota bacterium]|nr:peptidyl-prolyl cis-trans isomerase [Myxococcota bacterium]
MDASPKATPEPRSPTSLLALAAGAAVGLALAAASLLGTDPARRSLPDSAVARVNDTWITEDEYRRLVAGLESDTRAPAGDDAKQRVLDRLIEEELLVQRGLELGLAQNDRRVRGDIAQAMIRSVVVEVEDDEPSERVLRAFHEEQQGFFTQPGRLHLRQVFWKVPRGEVDAVLARAAAARARLEAGDDFDAVRAEAGDAPIFELPDAPLPAAKIREYLGPTALREAMALGTGERSRPFRSGTGVHVLELVDREPDRVPPFEEIAELVEQEWRRRAGDRALREYLDALRSRADVEVRETLP